MFLLGTCVGCTTDYSLTILRSFLAPCAVSLACSKLRDFSAALHTERLCNTCHRGIYTLPSYQNSFHHCTSDLPTCTHVYCRHIHTHLHTYSHPHPHTDPHSHIPSPNTHIHTYLHTTIPPPPTHTHTHPHTPTHTLPHLSNILP